MNILTFDVEDWFHILDNKSTQDEKSWSNYECRIHENMDLIFKFLADSELSATFFVVGWIAKKYPEIVKKIDDFGFEIGSHTHMHQLLYTQTYRQVTEDLLESIERIQNITGKKVEAFRAPGFSIREDNKWVFEVLLECGIKYDSSIFPTKRSHGGFQSFGSSKPAIIEIQGGKIKEFPINTISIRDTKWIFSGGGYFRITPYFLIKKWTSKSNYVMSYFHPRDFDYEQPIIKDLSMSRKFKSYVGLKNCMKKLEKWTRDYDFIDLRTANSIIDWDKRNTIKI